MNKILKYITLAVAPLMFTACLDETDMSRNYVSQEELDQAPKAFSSLVSAMTSAMCGNYVYWGNAKAGAANDYGYPSVMLQNDIMGQDIAPLNTAGTEWFGPWYSASTALNPGYADCDMPWTYYYGWINNCNIVLQTAGDEPTDAQKSGVGQAYALRAMFYLDLVRMYVPQSYSDNPEALSVPIVTDTTTLDKKRNNPRATQKEALAFILSDLDKAEKYLTENNDPYTMDLTVAYGLKARAYQWMADWPNAEKYAKLAQNGYTVMTGDQYTSRENGFAEPTGSWMFALKQNSTDYIVTNNDGDDCWAAKMVCESGSGCGYAANYGQPLYIDEHLYSSIPSTDFRKKCFLPFDLDDKSEGDRLKELADYSAEPQLLLNAGEATASNQLNGLNVKFRNAGGAAGRASQYTGWCVAIPLMRVEEMKLIEAEAAGMQNEARGIQLLTEFAKTRDPNYVYGTHNEAYGNNSTSAFQNEVWWERRAEFWGEGLAMYDIKRLNKGIIRSYAGTNHPEGDRWNTNSTPAWMTRPISSSETQYNHSIVNNPSITAPTEDSPEYKW